MVVWTFFGITLLWDWNENWPFHWKENRPQESCGHCWVFQICWHIECRTLTSSSFRVWNSSAGISSSPLALFIRKYLTITKYSKFLPQVLCIITVIHFSYTWHTWLLLLFWTKICLLDQLKKIKVLIDLAYFSLMLYLSICRNEVMICIDFLLSEDFFFCISCKAGLL